MLPMLQIGPLNIQTGGLILVLAAWLGMSLTEKLGKYSRVPPNLTTDAIIWGIGGGIIFARLGFSLASPDVLFQNPLTLISLNTYQLDLFSGLAGFFLTTAFYSSRKGLPFRLLLDAQTPFFICAAAGYALSTMVSGNVYGAPVSLPWAVSLWGISRHPVQIYDLLFICLAGYFLLKPLSFLDDEIPRGSQFPLLIAALAIDQIITSPFRGDPGITTLAGVRLQQIAAWVILAAALIILRYWHQPVQSEKEIS